MSKRGLSAVVITLIIVLLSLVAVGVVWTVVSRIIKSGSGGIGTGLEKLTTSLDITNAYEQSGNIIVTVKRGTGKENLIKIKFILSDGDSETLTEDTALAELEEHAFSLTPAKLISADIRKVSVVPVFGLADGSESVGDVTDTYFIGAEGGQEGQGEETPPGECTPDCGLRVCGPAPNGCGGGNACGVCASGTCRSDRLGCEGCSPDCTGKVCGDNGCGGTCEPGCNSGQMCQEGTCIEITPVNAGVVEETWPGTSGMYFGSSDLPITEDYTGYYLSYSDGIECLLIIIYRFPIPGYQKSHIGFNFETSIKTGDTYKIWKTLAECEA
jgi:hypothetical protein